VTDKRFGSWPAYNGQRVVLDNDPGLVHRIQVEVDFGPAVNGTEDTVATTPVVATWVTADSIIQCTVSGRTTPDHEEEDAALEGVTAYPIRIAPGVGFDVVASAPNGSWGRYLINITG